MQKQNVTASATTSNNKELLAKLHNSVSKVVLDSITKDALKNETQKTTEKNTKSTTASTTKAVVVKDVKDFISVKSYEQLQADKRKTVQQNRYYMTNKISEDKFEVFNKTMYVDSNNNRQILTQALARKFTQDYIQKVALKTQFSAQEIMHIHKTCGGAFGDLIRNALYETSLFVNTAKDSENKDIITKAKTLKKNCIYFNVNESESVRKRYNFVKIA